ncbi:MarR family winged helix-turn-helix transcriptional regulator [Phaeobacter sp.]|uniref:MarR family winged helix-turn-helix transcriptional regulator n=1 Tax=Phaeobacter sp. TaxID=1902409 RepID=UPI0025E4F43B|nr:MarR family winged helix-turn-helix transcriptional regulator [Phaeobacter sp.]
MTAKESSSSNAEFFGDYDERVAYNRVWFNVMRAHRKFHPCIAKALKTSGLNDPIWYEILLEVELAGTDGQPMAELEKKLFVPQYALSRHVSRLEKEGYLRREFIADGRRKQILFLTEKGTGVHLRVWPAYVEAMQAEIAPLMSTEDAYALSRLLIKLLP